MRISTIFVSATFLLAGISAALPVRLADPDFLASVEARVDYPLPDLRRETAYSINHKLISSPHRRSLFYKPSSPEITRRHEPNEVHDPFRPPSRLNNVPPPFPPPDLPPPLPPRRPRHSHSD